MRPPVHTQIGSVWIDVSIRQVHGRDADVTEHPVEQGSDIADHIRPREQVIQIDGMITNHPLELPQSHVDGARVDPSPITIDGELTVGGAGVIPGLDQGAAILGALRVEVRQRRQFSAQPLHFTSEFDRVTAVHRALNAVVLARQLVTIVTALETYESVALVHYEGTVEGRDRLTFSAEGRVLRIVSSQTVKLPDPVHARALPKKSDGKKSSSAATGAEEDAAASTTSFMAKILGIGGG